jgi:hypothetical protein
MPLPRTSAPCPANTLSGRQHHRERRSAAVMLGNPDLRVVVKPSAEPGYPCAAYAMTLWMINVRICRDECLVRANR